MKRVLTIQDISCVGKCSLGVALPIISAAGAEAAVLPTAVLSAHTAFSHVYKRDLSEDMEKIFSAWQAEGLTFDSVYTGYLASQEQIDTVIRYLDCSAESGRLVFVDPAMGDFGRLYAGFHASFPGEMARLCARADVIVPNLTEACALLDMPYREDYSWEQLLDLLRRLCAEGARSAVLTGVFSPKNANRLGVLKYDSRDDTVFSYFGEYIQTGQPLHGTGDVFASACVGALAAGMSLEDALSLAVDFTAHCAAAWTQAEDRRWYGVDFETALPYYIDRIREYKEKI